MITQANPEPGDRFGFSVATGEVTDAAQLIVDAPGEDVRSVADAGAVSVLFSIGPDGLGGAVRQFPYQGTGAAEPGDGAAGALATTAG